MAGYGFLSFAAILVCLGSINAISDEDKSTLIAAFQPFIMQCAEEYGVTQEQFQEAKKEGSLADIEPCFLSCVLKKAEFFDSKGMFDIKKSAEFAKANLKSEKAIQFFEAVEEKCVKVNDEEVTDGEEGCDRAKLMFNCLVDLKKEFNFED